MNKILFSKYVLMVNKVNLKLKEFLLLLLAMALFNCVSLELPYEEWEKERNVRFCGIVNDSLTLSCSYREIAIKNNWIGDCLNIAANGGCGDIIDDFSRNEGLHLVDSRTNEIYWQDTVNWEPGIQSQLSDSVMYGGDFNKHITLWKVGEKPIRVVIKKWENNNCSGTVPNHIYRIRPWENGKLLFIGYITDTTDSNICQYSVLDMETGVMQQYRFENEYKWLSYCLDVSYIDDKVVCFAKNDSVHGGVILMADGVVTDSSLANDNVLGYSSDYRWSGRYVDFGNGGVRKVLNGKWDNSYVGLDLKLIEYSQKNFH